MASKITPEERLLIDEAIARGMTQRIPSGVSGVPERPMTWREYVDRSYTNLRKREKLKSSMMVVGTQPEAIGAIIKNMVDAGKTNIQIAAATRLTAGAVAQRILRMGISRAPKKAGKHVPFGE